MKKFGISEMENINGGSLCSFASGAGVGWGIACAIWGGPAGATVGAVIFVGSTLASMYCDGMRNAA